MKIGICFGGYCPLHRGHMDLIMRARKECDKTFIVVCGYDNEPRGNEIGLTVEKRYRLIKSFLNDDITSVVYINDTELGLDESCSLNNWTIWTNKVMELTNVNINRKHFMPLLPDNYNISKDELVFYISENSYKSSLETIGYKTILMDRSNTRVSGTDIRKHPLKYWNYITKPFRPYMTTKILVIGTASEGKTTLCKDISNYYNIPWIPEYGRLYMEESGLTDKDLSLIEFKTFINEQTNLVLNCQANKGAESGIFISDTDNLITLMYAHAYAHRDDMPNISIEDYNKLLEYAKDKIAKVKWDYIIILKPSKQNIVDDGIRFMEQSSLQERYKNIAMLDILTNHFYKDMPIYVITENDYYNTFKHTCKIIEEFYKGER